MTELYIAPVGDDWIERFDQTVAEPVDLSQGDIPEELGNIERTRFWGTTWGKTKQSAFNDMRPGDLVLFYRRGKFFSSGRVGRTLENEKLADALWGNPGSRLIYTITEFEEISIPLGDIADVLGYSENFVPRGFMEVSETAVATLLQSYSSIEEAYQALTNGTGGLETGSSTDDLSNEGEDKQEVRKHTEIQWMLIQLGLKHGYDVYVAKNDKNLEYEGQRLGNGAIEDLVLKGFSDSTLGIIEYVDVIWLHGDYIVTMFEVESTTSIYSGILRMTDFMVNVPNLAVNMYIVAPSSDEQKVRGEMDRPTFRMILSSTDHSSLQYLSFEEVEETYSFVQQAGPLQQVF